MPLVATRRPLLGNLVKHEYSIENGYCRSMGNVKITAGGDVTIGSVLGFNGTSYVPRNPAATDGSEVAAAIAIENKTLAADTDTPVALLVRGPSIVGRDALVFDVAHNAGQKETAEAELEALGILVRKQV